MPDSNAPAAGVTRRATGSGESAGTAEPSRTNDASVVLVEAVAEFRAASARVEAVARYLAGETAGIESPQWMPVRDPETGQRLYDWHPSGKMRFVTKWHGERREVILSLPQVA